MIAGCLMAEDEGFSTYIRRIGQRGIYYTWGGVAHLALCGVYYIPWEHSIRVDFIAAEIPYVF